MNTYEHKQFDRFWTPAHWLAVVMAKQGVSRIDITPDDMARLTKMDSVRIDWVRTSDDGHGYFELWHR